MWLSAGLLATGAVLLATARLAGASPPSPGTFRVGMAGASVQIDPQLSYVTTGWWLEYATAAKLYNWSDRDTRLVPEVVSRVAVSNGGRTYTFFLRKSFRFSDGSPVTAQSFSYAFDRAANKDLASPAAQFVTDVRGVGARGRYRLVIRLVTPDPAFLARLTMPFFQATSTTLPLNREVSGGYPSAGPYYFASNDANTLTSIRRNPYYGGRRPAHVAGVDVEWNLNEEIAFHQVETDQLDEAFVPAAEAQGAAQRYGVNRTRFWVKPQNCVGLLGFNDRNPLLGHSVALRRAINWAVDRTAYAAVVGSFSATPWTHLLPPLFPGSITKKRLQPYSAHANIAKARKLAGAYVANRKITVGYRKAAVGEAQAQLVHDALVRLGFKPGNITMKGFSGGDIYTAMARQGSDLDLGVSMGYCAEYPDSYGVLRGFVADSPKYLTKLRAARTGGTRALGRLDLEITRNLAPAAVMRTYNNRYFFSGRVDPRSLRYSRVYQDWIIPALRLK
jgi:peptide/nickel transport system substrate-binding protein